MIRRCTRFLAVLLVMAGAATGCGGSAEDQAESAAPELTMSIPEFSPIPPGEAQSRALVVTNVGTAALHIERVEIEQEPTDAGPSFRADGWEPGAQDITLEPRESHRFLVSYTEVENGPDWGRVVIRSNDPANPRASANLRPPTSARVFVRQDPIRWHSVPPANDPQWRGEPRLVEVQNVGEEPLRISDITTGDNGAFRVTIPQPRQNSDGETEYPLEDDLEGEGWPSQVAPGASFPVRVWFEPRDRLPQEGVLVLESNDVYEPRYEVRLVGNAGLPCLETSVEAVEFGNGSIRRATRELVSIANCSRSEDLEVQSIAMRDDADGVFSIVQDSLPDELTSGVLTLSPGETRDFLVAFAPDEVGDYRGVLEIVSNDALASVVDVPVSGSGIDNACPTAVASATTPGQDQPQTSLTIEPLSILSLDGTASVDPDGDDDQLEFEWSLISRPERSTATLTADPSDATTDFFPDAVGVYEIELKVYDEQGLASCGEPAIIRVEATPGQGVYVQLVWDTPAGGDQSDYKHADLDLHYLHPHGAWDESPFDVFWRNPTPDWGVEGEPSDDPTLSIDDTDRGGPEAVKHKILENLIYQVGVYYYSDRGMGSSFATVAIYIDGTLALELEEQRLSSTGEFWRVGFIEWPSGNAQSVDRILEGFPNNP